MIDKRDIKDLEEGTFLDTANVNLYLFENSKTKTGSVLVHELNVDKDIVKQIRSISKDYLLEILEQAKSLSKIHLYNPDTGQEPFKIDSKKVTLFEELYPYLSGQKAPAAYKKGTIKDEKIKSWIFRFEAVIDGKIEQILFFQRFQPSRMLVSKGITIFEEGNKFKLLGEHVLSFNLSMDLMYYKDAFIVTRAFSFEHIFGYEEYYKKNAVTLVRELSETGFAGLKFKVYDVKAVNTKIDTNTRLAHKLYAASINRYYLKINYEKLLGLNKKHKLGLNLDRHKQAWIIDDKLNLQTMAQILNDDYELSQLTDNEYLAVGKERLN